MSWSADILRRHAEQLLTGAGLERDKAPIVAELLVEADLMGHDTHGLALLPRYLDEIASGQMRSHGAPEVLRDTKACVSWDGRRLSGVWLVAHALDLAIERAPTYGTVTVVIRNSHHIACLAAYLSRATDRGLMVLLSASDPSIGSVAPFGGTQGVFTPNPVAAGIPTDRDPILIDISASITTNNMVARFAREGERLPAPWLVSAAGEASDDPAVLKDGGALLTAGGLDHGQKGYGWALMAEALTQGLAGFGRADAPRGWGACVFLQVIDPDLFGGRSAFARQTGHLAEACRASRPAPGAARVRLPGENGLARKRKALTEGVTLRPSIVEGLQPWAQKLGIPPLS